jgi:hypothetical protein
MFMFDGLNSDVTCNVVLFAISALRDCSHLFGSLSGLVGVVEGSWGKVQGLYRRVPLYSSRIVTNFVAIYCEFLMFCEESVSQSWV